MHPETTMIFARTRQLAFLEEARSDRLAAAARRSTEASGRLRRHAGAAAWQHWPGSLAAGLRRVAGQI